MTLNSKTNTVDNDVLNSVLDLVSKVHLWRGTMSDLGSSLKTKNLPKSPSALRTVINRIVNRLRTRGVSVKFGRTNDRMRTRFVRLATR